MDQTCERMLLVRLLLLLLPLRLVIESLQMLAGAGEVEFGEVLGCQSGRARAQSSLEPLEVPWAPAESWTLGELELDYLQMRSMHQ